MPEQICSSQSSMGLAFEIQASIMEEVQKILGDSPQNDDITLMDLVRDK